MKRNAPTASAAARAVTATAAPLLPAARLPIAWSLL